MRKLIAVGAALLVGVFVLYAATPTVTTSTGYPKRFNEGFSHPYILYEYTATPSLQLTGDTLLLGPFVLGGIGHEDSLITIEMKSAETVRDSVHYKIHHQMSAAHSPGSQTNSKDWHSIVTDATAFDSTLSAYDTFVPRRYSASRHYRIMITNQDTTGVVGAGLTFRVTLPLK